MNRRAFILGGASLVLTTSVTTNVMASHKKSNIHHKEHFHPKVKYHNKTKIKLSKHDKNVLIETIWGEARGETSLGRMAVVHVILNRIYTNNITFKSYKSIAQVCLKKYQFSCWLDKFTMRHIKNDDTYKDVKNDVEKAIKDYEHGVDYSNGALFYFSDIIKPPKWVKNYKNVNKIGLHNFYA